MGYCIVFLGGSVFKNLIILKYICVWFIYIRLKKLIILFNLDLSLLMIGGIFLILLRMDWGFFFLRNLSVYYKFEYSLIVIIN